METGEFGGLAVIYAFDSFEIDTDQVRLIRAGAPVDVEPKVFDFLQMLAESPGRVFTRDEIIDRVWEGRIVSDATVSTCVKAARKALGDDGQRQALIRTVHGRGFSLVAAPKQAPRPERPLTQHYTQPAVVIPPTQTENASAEILKTAQGFADAIRNALGRVPFTHVVSRRAATTLGSKDLPDIHTEIGEGYLLDLVLSGAETVSVSAELVDIADGRTLWSRSADLMQGPDLRDRLVTEVLPHLEPALVAANLEKLRMREKGDPDPRVLVIEAFGVLALNGWNGYAFGKAEALIRRALDIDPDLPLARAILSLILALGQRVGFEPRTEARIAESLVHAEAAMTLAPVDSICLGFAGCALSDAGFTDRALPILQKSVDLNPVNAHGHAALGSAFLQKGKIDLAVEHLRRGIDLSPHDNRLSVWVALLAQAEFLSGDTERALASAERAVAGDDKTYLGRIILASLRLQSNDTAGAKAALKDCQRLKPDLSEDDLAPMVGRQTGAALAALIP